MKILEQFFHFCIVCWTLAGLGAIGSKLNFPHPDNYFISMFISLTILGIIGKEISSVIYYDKKSKLSIVYVLLLYLCIFLGLIFVDAFLFAFFIMILGTLLFNKLLKLNAIKITGLFKFQFYLEIIEEIKKRLQKTISK